MRAARCLAIVASMVIGTTAWQKVDAQTAPHELESFASTTSSLKPAPAVVEKRLTPPHLDPTEIDTSVYGAPALYELRFTPRAHVTVKVYDSGHDVLVPLDAFCRTAELQYSVDRVRRIAKLGKWVVRLTNHEFVMVGETPYVSLNALDRTTHETSRVDRDDATITLTNIETFPVARRARQAALREELVREGLIARVDTFDVHTQSQQQQWGGLSVDYSVLSQNTGGITRQDYSLAASTLVGGGSLVTTADGLGSGFLQGGATWLHVWPEDSLVEQLRLGDGAASGPGNLWSRGIFISNAPLVRRATVAVIPIDGSLPADWSIEAYRDGALVAFDSVNASGHYRLALPIQYGQNPFDLVAYGPAGETRQLAYVFRALPSLLPAHTFQYAASSGVCLYASCMWNTNADFQYGISALWAVRTGASAFSWQRQPTSLHPYVGLTAMPFPGVGFDIESMSDAYSNVSLRLDPNPTISLAGDYTKYSNTPTGAAYAGSQLYNQMSIYGSIAPGSRRPAFEFQALRLVGQYGTHGFARIGSAVSVSGATLRPYARMLQTLNTRQTFIGMDAMLMPSSWGIYSAHPWMLRGTLEATSQGAWSQASVILSRVDTHRFHIESGLQWQRGASRPQVTFAMLTDLGAIRSVTTATAATDRSGSVVTQVASGSLRWDETLHRAVGSPDQGIERAGVSGVVFLDENGNGELDPGEQQLTDVRVRVDNAAMVTDERGYYDIEGVLPGEIASVSLDSATLASPWWTPSFNQITIRTIPSRVVSVNIPVRVSGVVSGRVASSDGDPLRVSIVLTNLRTGARRTVDTFSDGGFYQLGLLPGQYTAEIDPQMLSVLHRHAQPVAFTIIGGTATQNVRITVAE